MNAVTLKEAKLHLEQLVTQVIADAEPTIVVSESGERAVFLSLDEYNSWKETLPPLEPRQCRASEEIDRGGASRQRAGAGALGGMKLTFTPSAWTDYLWFQEHDRKLLKRIIS